jgi:MFS family permease
LHPTPSQAEIKKSLKNSLYDGAFWSLTVGFSEIYFSPFALFLGASPLLLGILMTLPPLFGPLSQLFTSAAENGVSKRLVLRGGSQALFLLNGLLPFLGGARLWILFSLLSGYWVGWMIQVPAWQSWMGEWVPAQERGKYFSKRNRVIQIVAFLSLISAGAILSHFEKGPENLFWGFFVLFLVGSSGRALSFLFVGRQTDLKPDAESEQALTFLQFIRKAPSHSYGIFVLYSAFFSIAVNLSAPYFIPYFLENLQFSYLQLMGLIAAMVASKYLFLPYWGKRSDEGGSRRPFIAASLLFSLNPFFLLFSKNYYYLMAVQMILGLGLAGFELLSFNFLLENTPKEERTRLAAYYETLVGIGTLIGALGGGCLLSLSSLSRKAYVLIFLISGIARLALSLAFLPRLAKNPKPLQPSLFSPSP